MPRKPKASNAVEKKRSSSPAKTTRKAGKKTDGDKRKPSAYNNFVKKEMAKIKAEDGSIAHKDAFKLAAARWKTAPENSKSKSTTSTSTSTSSSSSKKDSRSSTSSKSDKNDKNDSESESEEDEEDDE
eukprot:TRINITY_DN595_c4_g1_i1.p1 TRINITY_DN595_c4_g1~~TRINITY_DN595_c4_g1_i1.p1  ORF type:complete len:128 (+),score=69.19 TRINITY_DN595_c4_g1_i1:166-549(+)